MIWSSSVGVVYMFTPAIAVLSCVSLARVELLLRDKLRGALAVRVFFSRLLTSPCLAHGPHH